MSPPDVIMRPQQGGSGGWMIQKSWSSEREAVQYNQYVRSREFRAKQIRGSGYRDVRDQEALLRLRTLDEYYQQIANMDQQNIRNVYGNSMTPLAQPLGNNTVEEVANVEKVLERVIKIATASTTMTSVQPPPGFGCPVPTPGRYPTPVINNACNFNDDLDINMLIDHFKSLNGIDEENQKTLLLRMFCLESLNSENAVKSDGRSKQVYKDMLTHMSSEKLGEITCDYLKEVGFDGILSHKANCSDANFNDLAQEVCFNDQLVYDVVSACNTYAADKKRMKYVDLLDYYASLAEK